MSKRICGILLACGLLAACSQHAGRGVMPEVPVTQDRPPITALSITPRISHITVVIMENYSYQQIIGSSAAPYTNQFAKANALFTNSHGVTHPSEPNYLALFSGSTQGVTSDYCPVTFGAENLGTELLSHGFTFQGYSEYKPSSGNPCYAAYSPAVASHYLYWRKHVPWSDFTNFTYGPYSHSYNGPGTPLTGSVNFIVPDICNDQHDCSIATGDAWLSKNIPPILSYDSTHNGLLILTYDEGDSGTGNHVVTIMAGPMVPKGLYSQSINHYNVLRLIEANFGLPLLGASSGAAAITMTAPVSTSSSATTITGTVTYCRYYASTGGFQI